MIHMLDICDCFPLLIKHTPCVNNWNIEGSAVHLDYILRKGLSFHLFPVGGALWPSWWMWCSIPPPPLLSGGGLWDFMFFLCILLKPCLLRDLWIAFIFFPSHISLLSSFAGLQCPSTETSVFVFRCTSCQSSCNDPLPLFFFLTSDFQLQWGAALLR